MPDDVQARTGLIGPNAILQYIHALDDFGGAGHACKVLRDCGLFTVPEGDAMIPEEDAARLHRFVRRQAPSVAPLLSAQAGVRTADYILKHRIPRAAQRLLRALPAPLAAVLLAKAIAQNAWTFVGSGTFQKVDVWTFCIVDNPLVRGEVSEVPICHWHCAVFEHLYRSLVAPDCRCREVTCCAQHRGDACWFEIYRSGHS